MSLFRYSRQTLLKNKISFTNWTEIFCIKTDPRNKSRRFQADKFNCALTFCVGIIYQHKSWEESCKRVQNMRGVS